MKRKHPQLVIVHNQYSHSHDVIYLFLCEYESFTELLTNTSGRSDKTHGTFTCTLYGL